MLITKVGKFHCDKYISRKHESFLLHIFQTSWRWTSGPILFCSFCSFLLCLLRMQTHPSQMHVLRLAECWFPWAISHDHTLFIFYSIVYNFSKPCLFMVILSFLRFCWWWWFFDTYRHCCNKLYTITCTSWCFYFYRWHFQGGFAVPTHMFFLFNNFRTWFPNTFLFTMYETGCFPSFLPGLGVLMMVLLLCFSTLQGKK